MDVAKWRRIRRPWEQWDEISLRANLGVYVHIPFCRARCRYCGFLSFGAEHPDGLTPASYVETLLEEIARRGDWVRGRYESRGRRVDTVFVGGGTPTYLPGGTILEVLHAVMRHFPLCANGLEVTVEANPDTLNQAYLATLVQAGVNRLSVGVQATQDRHLRFLGRTHRWRRTTQVLEDLRKSAIPRFSIDLMYGLPRLTLAELKRSLRRLLAYGPGHISAYELTPERDTAHALWAAHFPQQVPTSESIAGQQRALGRLLADHGLYRYEVSNYARPGEECRHNLRYWRGGDYVGLGLGAASRIGGTVVDNPRDLAPYLDSVKQAGSGKDPLVQAEQMQTSAGNPARIPPPADRFLRLRTRGGVPLDGTTVQPYLIRSRLIRVKDRRLAVTAHGLSFADYLARTLP